MKFKLQNMTAITKFLCTLEPRYNEPFYNEVLGTANVFFFFTPVIVKYMSYLNTRSFCSEMNKI